MKKNFIALIPKTDQPHSPADFKPISLPNEIYKIITRIIAARLKPLMAKIIHPSQTGFIPGRSIWHNILLSNDLIKGFHLCKGDPKMCLKLDLCKAFDSVRWDFVKSALIALNFPSKIIKLILECIKEPAFSILINGEACDFFKSSRGRGLRQG